MAARKLSGIERMAPIGQAADLAFAGQHQNLVADHLEREDSVSNPHIWKNITLSRISLLRILDNGDVSNSIKCTFVLVLPTCYCSR